MNFLRHLPFSNMLAAGAFEDSYAVGQFIAWVIGLGFLLPGLIKCVKIMRRPATSTQCVIALLLVLSGFLVNLLWTISIRVFPLEGPALGLHLILVIPLLIASLVIGIIGLVEYQSDRFNQGRKQAVWAIILALMGMGGSVSTLPSIFNQDLRGVAGADEGMGEPGAEVVREQFNFALRPPDATWRSIPPKSISSSATAVLRGQEDLYASVIAEIHPSLVHEGIEVFVAAVKANLADEEVKEETQERRKLDALEFVRLRTIFFSESAKMDIAMEQWLTTHNGYAWKIVVWGSRKNEDLVKKEAEAMARGFRILDPLRTPALSPAEIAVRNPDHGYHVRLSNGGWKKWTLTEDESKDLPEGTDFAANTMGSVFLVTPWRHEMEDPPPAPEALARAFLAQLDFSYERNDAAFATRSLTKPFPGVEITTERETDSGPYRYLFRVHQSGRHAWLIGGWIFKRPGGNLDSIRAACDSVNLFGPTTPSPDRQIDLKKEIPEAKAKFVNQIGIWYHQKENGREAARYFQEASRLQPESLAFFANITQALESDGRDAEALALMDTASERPFAREQAFKVRHAWLRVKAGQVKEGAGAMTALIDDGFAEGDTVLSWINEFLEHNHIAEARALAEIFVKRHPEPRHRLWLAETIDREDEEAAAVMLEKLIADEPDYLPARYTYGEFSNRRGKHEAALEQAEFLREQGQDTARLHLMRGWAHMGRKWYRDARASFDKAAEAAPHAEDVKYALQEVSAHLGQGSNQEIKTPIEAVPLPAGIASRLDELRRPPAEFGEGYNSALLLWSCAYQVTPDKPLRTTTRSIVRIMNEEGAGAYSTIQHRYDPLFERLYVSRVEVLDAGGKVTSRAAIEDMYVLDTGKDSMADTDRMVHIQVPGLKPGNILDYEITVERLSKMKDFPMRRHLFGTGVPTQLEVISIHGNTAVIRQELVHGSKVKKTEDKDSVVFECANPPLLENEDYAVPAETWAPLLVLSPADQKWETVAHNHLQDITPQLKPDPEVEEEARRLTRGLTGTREKARALTAFVQKTIRYKAIEFGVRGYVPNPAGQTLRQRYGDCKDQAVLLHQLLGAAGIASHLALVETGWEVDRPPPAVDAFNHMIVFVPGLPFPGFIDPTSSYLAAADHAPSGLWGYKALVLNPDKPELVEIPGPAANAGRVESRRTVSLSAENEVNVREEVTLHGYYASSMRGRFAGEEPKARFQSMQDLLDGMGNYRLRDFEFVNLTEPSLPAVLRLTYLVPNAVEVRGEARKLRLPCAWEAKYLRLPFIKDRSTDFRWAVPFVMSSELVFDSSVPLAPETLAAFDSKRESPFGKWHFQSSEETLAFEVEIKTGNYEADKYETFQSLWSAAYDAWTKEVTLTPP